jgi:AcrR family transcriptional regulator
MSPRRYDRRRRDAALHETRRRIVAATVALHAERGALATSYAMIAERADVAVPTVYNHFPTQVDLLAACTADTVAQAPAVGPEILQYAADAPARLVLLARAVFARHRFLAPWLRWAIHEAHQVPAIAAFLKEADDARLRLIEEAVGPAFTGKPPATLLAVAAVLLGFESWHALTAAHGLSAQQAETTVVEALHALLRQHAAPSDAERGKTPKRRRQQS